MDRDKVISGSIALVATAILGYVAWSVYKSTKGSSCAAVSVGCCGENVEP